MVHVSVGVYTFLLPIAIIVTVVVFFIYKAIYDKHTNQVLESGGTKKRKWIAPWGLALIVLGAQLLMVAGVMFPLSMFMIDQNVGYSVHELSDDDPMQFDVSDSVMFVIDDSNYQEVTKFSDEGITVTIYKQQRKDDTEYFVFIGEIEKQSDEPINAYVCLDTNSQTYQAQIWMPSTSESSKAYFKAEVMTGADSPSSLRIAVGYGDSMNPETDDLPQDIKIVF